MSTEDEILANQTQTLEEALDRLEDRATEIIEPTTVPDVGTDALNIAVECLKATADLYRTISQEGVSVADVQALRAIQTKMLPHARLKTKVALEAYEGMFTTQRSMINQTISQEAALGEIGKTLKEWFFIFVDFIIRVVDWCRRVWNSEELIRKRLNMMDSYIQMLYNRFQEIMKYNKALGHDATKDMNALAETVLADPKLERSRSTLLAFNAGPYTSNMLLADRRLDNVFGMYMKDVATLKSHIEQNKPGKFSYFYAMEINEVADSLDDMAVADVEDEKFMKFIRNDFWTRPKQLVSRQIFAPSHNIEQVQTLAKEVRSIKRNNNFDDLKEVDIMVNAIESLSDTVKGLERVIKFKQKLYSDYYKASATYANFYIRGREAIAEQIRTNSAADFDQVVMKRMDEAWEAILDKMGI